MNGFPYGRKGLHKLSSTTATVAAADLDSMQISVKTDNTGTSNDDQFTLPANGGPYDVTDWGDGESSLGVSNSQTHIYGGGAGTYTYYSKWGW